jgi:hypothetical protein
MRRDRFKNVEWLEAQPTIRKVGDKALKYENTGARVWLHDPVGGVATGDRMVTREYFHEEKNAWIPDRTFKAYTKEDVMNTFLKNQKRP